MPEAKRWIVLSVLLLAVATSAGAGYYTVTLKNGTTFETREEPVPAEWDPELRMLLTDKGNWIALRADEILDVVSSAEASGLGYQLDTTTVVIGFSEQDVEREEEGEGEGGGRGGPSGEQIDYGPASVIDYGIDQFLDMPTANPGGGGTSGGGGIPVWGFPPPPSGGGGGG